MEVELAEPMIEDEDDDTIFHDHNNDDYSSLDAEGERCGICMDAVIDRGVLDCCHHWYCFTCIDNWATITNLCPLCQNEFQSITCVPVYDTIGSNNSDDVVLSREDDWNIDGENNTLSLPSYYIDENAVLCLDGDGCKIRNGSVTIEDDPDLDTSIACDSCDTWYHAFCVGFDTEGTCETSWLCPGCIANGRLELSRGNTLNGSGECSVEAFLSRKVSVAIADAGETAVVVSMVERNEETQYFENNKASEGPNENLLPTSRVDEVPKIETLDFISNVKFSKVETTPENNSIQTFDFSCALSEQSEVKAISTNLKEPTDLSGELFSRNELGERSLTRHLDLSENSSLNGDTKNNVVGDRIARNMGKESTSASLLQDVSVVADRKENAHVIAGMKRKLRELSHNEHIYSGDEATKIVTTASKKKNRVDKADGFSACGFHKSASKRETDGSDIMSIVQETNRTQRDKAAGLRVKKIMRRDTKDKDSSVLVEKLRKEIREAVRVKSELGENQFNPDLLAAFRVAVSGSVSESAKIAPALVLKAKKVIIQKGKVRENLTKKIYGSGGKRKGGWTRDCEIEFWKHRCLQAGKPEKIDTLKNVLNLLRKSSDEREVIEGEQGQGTTSILSRLYLADSSVFPRKDDLKPLCDIGINSIPENIEENVSLSSLGSNFLKTPQKSKVTTQNVKTTNVKSDIIGKSENIKTDKKKWALEILARKTALTSKGKNDVQEDDPVFKTSYPLLAQLPVDMRPVLASSHHKKIPMSVRQAQLYRLTEHFLRKANLPVIRRTADTELAVADAVNIEKEIADKSNSKLVYTNLMSQQASHKIESTSSSKTPAVDPTVLASPNDPSNDPSNDLFVEEALENAGLFSDPSNDPSAEEVKSGVFLSDPSNDPSVEEALKKTSLSSESANDPSVEEALKKAGFLSDSPPNSPCDRITENREPESANDPSVEEALKKAGFLSDSPPNSPCDRITENREGEEQDLLGMGCHAKVDTYSDSEYNLENKDIIGASTIKIIKPQEDEGVKISNFNSDNVSHEGLERKTEAKADGCSHKDPVIREGDLVVQCEELYGPDKKPLVKKFPENEKFGLSEQEIKLENKIYPEDIICPRGGVDELVCSQTSENVPKEDKLADTGTKKQSDSSGSISKKVEAYIKEHIRPLCKSGVITVEQYRWSVEKTTEKVMKYHSKEKNANFLIKEGDKVKKLAEQYVEASQHKKKK